MYNIDKLFEAVAAKGHVCVGLDTAAEYVPPLERRRAASGAEAVLSFNKALFDATHDVAACYKVQIAYYEEMGITGLWAYAQTLSYIRAQGGLVIADIKRGDIADTALRYAKAHYEGEFEADFVTLSPYMGMDSIEPWLNYADSKGKGAFVLMRTSNKGMRDFEYLELAESREQRTENREQRIENREQGTENREQGTGNREQGTENREQGTGNREESAGIRRVYHAVGDKLAALAEKHSGTHGYGAFGAVVGCTERDEAAAIRANYPQLFFLIPGYGAQGGAADDAALLLREGNGGVVNASRSILKAWSAEINSSGGDEKAATNLFAAEAARRAAIEMRDAIRAAVQQ